MIFHPTMLAAALWHTLLSGDPHGVGLAQYIEKDLRLLNKEEVRRLDASFEAVVAVKPSDRSEWTSLAPWWIKPFRREKAAWMFLEAYSGRDIPDVSRMKVHLLDENWRRIASVELPTGYRRTLHEAVVSRNNPLKVDILVAVVVETRLHRVERADEKSAPASPCLKRQYYGFIDADPHLVRFADGDGRLLRLTFQDGKAFYKGPALKPLSRDEWSQRLNSRNAVEQLSALAWLSGRHLPVKADSNQPPARESAYWIHEEILHSPRTQRLLQELSESPNQWVREYATLTQEVIQSGVSRTD